MTQTELKQSTAMEEMRGALLRIATALVDDPLGVTMATEEMDGVICFRLRVRRDDVGKLIGRQGRTARSIRTVLSAASMKHGKRFALDIVEEGVKT